MLLKIVLGLVVLGGGAVLWMASRLDPDVELGAAPTGVVLTTLDDQPLALDDLRGKVVLLDFWGST